MAGINFVITGKVNIFANRNSVKEIIEARGGKVTGSVTSKTNFLINNDGNLQMTLQLLHLSRLFQQVLPYLHGVPSQNHYPYTCRPF